MRKRKIIGIQVHHSEDLQYAGQLAAGMLASLRSAITKAGPDSEHGAELVDAYHQLEQVPRVLGNLAALATLRIQTHQADPDFVRYREGHLPWPDEDPGGFEPVCTCHDRCAIHDGLPTKRGGHNFPLRPRTPDEYKKRSADEGWECQCQPCPRHEEEAEAA